MESPLLVTVAIIHRHYVGNREILLVRRARDPHCGKWSLIGGIGAFKDFSMDPQRAVTFEVKCDIDVEYQEPTFFQYQYDENPKPSVSLVFKGYISGTPSCNPLYVQEYKWFSIEEALSLDIAFSGAKVLSEYFHQNTFFSIPSLLSSFC